MAGIYMHIPYCRQACYYCDFHFSTSLRSMDDMVEAMCYEIAMRKDFLSSDDSISTLYLGGGTPSLLPENLLVKLVNQLHQFFRFEASYEFTLEANPDDINIDQLSSWKSIGINRLSIGVQSFNSKRLLFLNRIHTSDDAFRAVDQAITAGITNLNLDLMYAIPDGQAGILQQDLAHLTQLNPQHISIYSLTIEPATVFGNWLKRKKIVPIPEDAEATDYEYIMDTLVATGYDHYEISNFSRPGFESRHNAGYWLDQQYLGIGPGAHGYNRKIRYYNVRNNQQYINSIGDGDLPGSLLSNSKTEHLNDYILSSLRSKWGCDLQVISSSFGYDFKKNRIYVIADLIEKNLLTMESDRYLILTRKGKLLADSIAMELMV